MNDTAPFDAERTKREVAWLDSETESVMWSAPNGLSFDLVLPKTVYPPREDTDLLAAAMLKFGVSKGMRVLDIGCGSGVLSLLAASEGCHVTACDINPYAVATVRAHAANLAIPIRVNEGGPGPVIDGSMAQWGGDALYDVVVWNMPYLPPPRVEQPVLGPMEEASLVDTDDVGLFQRLVTMLANGRLLAPKGKAFVVVSSAYEGERACVKAWSSGLAARPVADLAFADGETLTVLCLWQPYEGAHEVVVDEATSTNLELLNDTSPVGTVLRAAQQSAGRGQRGRVWQTLEDALLASWVIADGPTLPHHPVDQVLVGWSLATITQHVKGLSSNEACVKWPNDLYLATPEGWRKAAGVLFDSVSQGATHRLVLGIGLNTSGSTDGQFAGVNDGLAQPLAVGRWFSMVHAAVASLFEDVHPSFPHGREVWRHHVEQAVLEGVNSLGPLTYRNQPCEVEGLGAGGELKFSTPKGTTDEPNDVAWSKI